MNLWQWVYETESALREEGHTRLADIIDGVPGLVLDGNHEQAEALVEEGLALVRELDHAWLEVFLRHWLAQSRILHRHDVTRGMSEVIALLDFSHEERTRGCPQSVCVVQDVCSAYGVLDGPGYAAERLAVSAEAMGRIDPTWQCFECIATEHAEALIDSERFADAEQYCKGILEQSKSLWQMRCRLADALSRQGRHDEALVVLARQPPRDDRYNMIPYRLHKTRELAACGRVKDALALRVSLEEIDAGEYVLWTRATAALVERKAVPNDAALGTTLRSLFTTLRTNGALYHQANLACMAASFAVKRGARTVVALWIKDIEALIPRLRDPTRVNAQLEHLRASFAAQSARPALPPEEAVQFKNDDAEAVLDALHSSLKSTPDHEELLLAYCSALEVAGFHDIARQQLELFVARNAESMQAFDVLLRALVRDGDSERLLGLEEACAPERMPRVLFYRARLLQRSSRWEEAASVLERARALEPDVAAIPSDLAFVYRHVGRQQEALALLDDLTAALEPGSNDWERMVVATWLGQYDKVRESAKRLGFEFDGEGRIDEPCGTCDLKITDDLGKEQHYRATRTGPVTARIVDLVHPSETTVFDDEWLFDPTPLNPTGPEEEDDAKSSRVHVFGGIACLSEGGYRTYDLDGISPSDAQLEALRESLHALGVILSLRGGSEYMVVPPGGERKLPGLYAYIVVPKAIATEVIYDVVSQHVVGWEYPVTYRLVLAELAKTDELQAQERLAEVMEL